MILNPIENFLDQLRDILRTRHYSYIGYPLKALNAGKRGLLCHILPFIFFAFGGSRDEIF